MVDASDGLVSAAQAGWRPAEPISADDLERTLRLLREVLPSSAWDDDTFIDHWYNQHPNGPAVQQNLDDADGRLVHVAAVPAGFHNDSREKVIGLIVNASASPKVTRMGKYIKLLVATREAVAAHGGLGIFGVSNDAGTPAALAAPGHTYVEAMPVVARPANPFVRGVRSERVDASWLAGDAADRLIDAIDQTPRDERWSQRWTPALLRWRLSNPGGAYSVHWCRDVIGISTRVKVKAVPVAVVLGLFRRTSAATDVVSGAPVFGAAARHHKVVATVYAGTNNRVETKGVTLPRRYLPSPLNILFASGEDDYDPTTFRLSSIEFLDFDAF
ncbi:MAG: hypothetical protein KDB35_16710 [Acidimicrobiales bacterium]|nr:hypothetical protein [Acidimicrobiales bacterium]MCB1261818.1 hypothetical protein [Acidimicrobiales bacterium]